jgi:hypothetical protein
MELKWGGMMGQFFSDGCVQSHSGVSRLLCYCSK